MRPTDRTLLSGRPLLDLGTGDGQTLAALAPDTGPVVGIDRSIEILQAGRPGDAALLVCADALALPFCAETFRVALAADLFHHLDDAQLRAALAEIRRALKPSGTLVAWWYAGAGRPGPDAPRYPRTYDAVAAQAITFRDVAPLQLEASIEPAPATAGLVARR